MIGLLILDMSTALLGAAVGAGLAAVGAGIGTVSYTHLTLPTKA